MLTQKDAVEVKIVDLAQEKVRVMKAKADLEQQIMSFGKDGADPLDVISEGEFEKRVSKSRDTSHIKFLEMLCILESAILELET